MSFKKVILGLLVLVSLVFACEHHKYLTQFSLTSTEVMHITDVASGGSRLPWIRRNARELRERYGDNNCDIRLLTSERAVALFLFNKFETVMGFRPTRVELNNALMNNGLSIRTTRDITEEIPRNLFRSR
jgi:hypothetical protein